MDLSDACQMLLATFVKVLDEKKMSSGKIAWNKREQSKKEKALQG